VGTIREMLERNGFEVTRIAASHVLYSRRRHPTGRVFEWLADRLPTFGAHIIVIGRTHVSPRGSP
jgi:hypothetical protein